MRKIIFMIILLTSFGCLRFEEDKLAQEDKDLITSLGTKKENYQSIYSILKVIFQISYEDYRLSLKKYLINNNFCGQDKQNIIADKLRDFYLINMAVLLTKDKTSSRQENIYIMDYIQCAFNKDIIEGAISWRNKNMGIPEEVFDSIGEKYGIIEFIRQK